jgi:glutathione S-transferase
VERGLAELASELGDRYWCHNDRYSLADIALGCCLGWLAFRHPSIDWRGRYDNLAALYERLSERPSFADTAPR